MQGLILAAGMGKRLGKYTQEQTKCMVKVKGKALIEYALEALRAINLSRVVIVIGYQGDKLKQFIGPTFQGMEIIYVTNEVFDRTNNIFSLWLASKYLTKDDTIVLESDLIFEAKILRDLVANPHPNLAVVAKYEPWMDGTVTILDENDKILNFISKRYFDWDKTDIYYKTVNIYKFSKEFSKNCYMPFLEAYVKTMGKNEYYEQVLRVITYLENIDLKAQKLSGDKWYEIDDIQDLDIAEMLFAEGSDELSLYQKRYGGYWRFPKMKDFCYLVNPYFPAPQLLNELKASFDFLIRQYPSGLNTQNLLAAKLFGCDESEIIVGNGASELINGLARVLKGNFGVVYPTFNEYPERIGYDRIMQFSPSNKNFTYSIENLKKLAANASHLLLINPDNPSGGMIKKTALLELLDFLSKRKISLVLDESFIDFAGKDLRYTLIDSEILGRYPNLIVIKSISKSYGVPGLRLGVLACANRELLTKIHRELPIWNINSFAEYFLQIIGKYKTAYLEGCNLLAAERSRFYQSLSMIKFLRVIPSFANYFLCEVKPPYTSTALAEVLLTKYKILIKDCSGKKGFPNGNYIRIAIRDGSDNDFLLKTLLELEQSLPGNSPRTIEVTA